LDGSDITLADYSVCANLSSLDSRDCRFRFMSWPLGVLIYHRCLNSSRARLSILEDLPDSAVHASDIWIFYCLLTAAKGSLKYLW
jgi:hypothetical protein